MISNRKDVRAALAALLQVNMTLPQAVYPYKVGDLEGRSPVVVVLSAGTGRLPMTFRGNRAEFRLEIHLFTLDAISADGWEEADVEEMMDNLEHEVAGLLETYRSTDDWKDIQYADASTIREVEIGGRPYNEEIIPIIVKLFK